MIEILKIFDALTRYYHFILAPSTNSKHIFNLLGKNIKKKEKRVSIFFLPLSCQSCTTNSLKIVRFFFLIIKMGFQNSTLHFLKKKKKIKVLQSLSHNNYICLHILWTKCSNYFGTEVVIKNRKFWWKWMLQRKRFWVS